MVYLFSMSWLRLIQPVAASTAKLAESGEGLKAYSTSALRPVSFMSTAFTYTENE